MIDIPSSVTVVMPTFNRAHLLPRVIPTYVQESVREIILVDDGSEDNTQEVVKTLQSSIPILRYHRLDRNCGQTVAKNAGLELVTTPLVFFGDDDSLLLPGTVPTLLDCMQRWSAEIVGARAVYMLPGESLDEALERTRSCKGKPVVSLNCLAVQFDCDPGYESAVPFVHACALVDATMAKMVKFDPIFSGSAYREETDFQLRCARSGASIVFCPQAVSVNLPREEASGGAWSRRWFPYERSTVSNNWIFLRRHGRFLKERWGLRRPLWQLQVLFVTQRFDFRMRQMAKHILGDRFVRSYRSKRRSWIRGRSR